MSSCFCLVSNFEKNKNIAKRHKLDPTEPRKLVLKSTIFAKLLLYLHLSIWRLFTVLVFQKKEERP